MKKFTVGKRVGCAIDEDGGFTDKLRYEGEFSDGPVFGMVAAVLTGGKVKVLWDDDGLNEQKALYNEKTGKQKSLSIEPATMDSKMLMPEAEIKAKFSELEKEYEVVAVQIKSKLTEAGKLIKEAHKMAKKSGADSLHDMYDAVDPLIDAMDACGWRTSSFDC
jgi:hypothetical protein